VLSFEYRFVTMCVNVVLLTVQPIRLRSLIVCRILLYLNESKLVEAAAYHSVGLFVLKSQLMHVVLKGHIRILSPVQLVLQRLHRRLKVFIDLRYLFFEFTFQKLLALLSFVFFLHQLHLKFGNFFFKFKLDVQQGVRILLCVKLSFLH
jgi:hypothetical protein